MSKFVRSLAGLFGVLALSLASLVGVGASTARADDRVVQLPPRCYVTAAASLNGGTEIRPIQCWPALVQDAYAAAAAGGVDLSTAAPRVTWPAEFMLDVTDLSVFTLGNWSSASGICEIPESIGVPRISDSPAGRAPGSIGSTIWPRCRAGLPTDPDGYTHASITVMLSSPWTSPLAVPDQGQANANESVELSVLSNDDLPNGATSVQIVSAPSDGSAEVVGQGPVSTVRYSPTPGFSGVDSFVYEVEDEQNQTSSAQVTVTVGGEVVTPPPSEPPTSTPAPTPAPTPTPVTPFHASTGAESDGSVGPVVIGSIAFIVAALLVCGVVYRRASK